MEILCQHFFEKILLFFKKIGKWCETDGIAGENGPYWKKGCIIRWNSVSCGGICENCSSCGKVWGYLECFGFCATRVDDIAKINFRLSRRHSWRGSVHTYRPHKWGGATLAPNPFPLTKSRTRGRTYEY